MYNVLLVDDEKIIREGVYELLSMEEELELDLIMADSAVNAIDILNKWKIDIIITDISMPQMSGLELFDTILEKWPHCKVIFLTGYSEFDYVYQVHKHARYVLKAEDDRKVIEAVKESIAEIEKDLLMEEITESRTVNLNKVHVYERMQFLRELVSGCVRYSQVTKELLQRLDIQINLDKKVYCVMLHYDNISCDNYEESQNRMDKIYMLIEKYYFDLMQGTYFEHNKNFVYMLLQPKKLITSESTMKMLEGVSELFQKALKKNMEISVSIFINDQSVLFPQAISDFDRIVDRTVLLSEEDLLVGSIREEKQEEEENVISEEKRQELLRWMQQMEYYFVNLEKDSIHKAIIQIRDVVQHVESMHDLFVLEIYCLISSRLLGSIKRLGLNEEMAFRIGIMNLYNVSLHANWWDAFTYLNQVAKNVFELKDINRMKQNEDVTNKVKAYIRENLSGDTSLYALSNYVHLSQEHLLRIFKKKEGITILQYINELKISTAKQLLKETDMQIREITEELGFTSAGYFGRFFKSKTKMTPHEYREKSASADKEV